MGLLASIARPQRRRLALVFALLLAEAAASLSIPLMGGALAEGVARGAMPAMQQVLAALLGVFAAQALLRAGSAYLLESVVDRLLFDLRMRLYEHLQALPLSFHQQRRLGDSLALLTHDAYAVSAFITGTLVSLVPLAVTAGGAAFIMLRIRPELAAIVILLVPLFYIAAKVVGRRLRPLSEALQEEAAGAVALAQENLAMLPAIKTFTREAQETLRYRAQLERILALAARQRRIQVAFGPAMHFAAAAGMVLVFAAASGADGLPVGELVAFLLYAHLIARPVAGLADVYGQTQAARGAVARMQRVFGEVPEDAPGEELPKVTGAIAFNSLTFAYAGRDASLRGLDLRIGAGEHVALVGPNGAGKSTLAHLLMRLHQPQEGNITIDGIDIATVSLASLRAQVGIVPQSPMLFHGSVRDNIAYGRPAPGDTAIEAAARAACAHDFIMELPQGYETLIGDRGVRLSGGQRQRVALARALLKDPPILILDEATAMLDPEGEEDFLAACAESLRRRTVLFITHRPASLATADRIVHLRAGRIDRIETRGRGPRLAAGD